MAQYPQGIFQSLQYLLKQIKILALQKQPVYNVGTVAASTTYTMPGKGIYYASAGSNTTSTIKFPDPALCSGQTIYFINTGSNSFQVSTTNQPKGSTNNSNQGVISGNVQAFFTSNGVNWYTIGI